MLKNWDLVYAITEGVIKRDNTDKSVNQIVSASQSLMGPLQIMLDVYLIATFHEYFLFTQFPWLHKGDTEIGSKPGFLVRNIAVRYFLIH